MMNGRNYNLSFLIALFGLTPACLIADKNLGETGEEDADDGWTNPDEDTEEEDTGLPGDLPGEEPTTCGNDVAEPDELCFELISLPVAGEALDVEIRDIDAAGEMGFADIIALTSSPAAPLVIWHNDPNDENRFETEPEIVAGPLPTATVPGLEIGDFDPSGTEYIDIAYASAEGVVIGWDKGLGVDAGFDEVTLAAACANPMSFAIGYFDGDEIGDDVICAHEAEGGGIEVLLASNLEDRNFAPPIPVGSDLDAITPLRAFGFSGFVAHDRDDQLIVWEALEDEILSFSHTVPALAWSLGVGGGADLVVVSHDPQGLLMLEQTPEGEFVIDEQLATDALPYQVAPIDLNKDLDSELVTVLGSGHLDIRLSTDGGLADPVLVEVGPEPRELAHGWIGWTDDSILAVTTADGVALLYPDP